MNNISADDSIFDFDSKHTLAFSYYGWEVNNQHAFYNYLIGYKTSADATFEAFKKAILLGDNETADTICYPLIYLYRHMTELMLKYSFIELKKNRTNTEIELFLKKGHNLKDLWKNVKPDFERLSKRTGVAADVLAIEHYINELTIIDGSSMAYRYPIQKNLSRFHNKHIRLNVPRLKTRMDAFYDYMTTVIAHLSQHLEDFEYNFEFDNEFTCAIYKFRDSIKDALNRIADNIEEYSHNNDIYRELDDLINGDTDIYEWTNSFSEQEKSVILLLYYTGRMIPFNTLAIDNVERRKDVMRLAYGAAQDWLKLDAPKSDTKDGCFMEHITCGGKFSKKYIETTLYELGCIQPTSNNGSVENGLN